MGRLGQKHNERRGQTPFTAVCLVVWTALISVFSPVTGLAKKGPNTQAFPIDFDTNVLLSASTDYTLNSNYTVVTSPKTISSSLAALSDHTGRNNGHFAVFGGDGQASDSVLYFNLTGLTAYANYTLTFYAATVSSGANTAQLQGYNGSTSLGTVTLNAWSGSGNATWQACTFGFNADASGNATLSVNDVTTTVNGANIFAIDDVSYARGPIVTPTISFTNPNGVTTVKETDSATVFAQVSRPANGDLSQALRVYLINSTQGATYGTDYTCPELTALNATQFPGVYYVTIPVGSASQAISFKPVADWVPEPDETVGWRLVNQTDPIWPYLGTGYTPTDTGEIVVTLQDVSVAASLAVTNPTVLESQTQSSLFPVLTFSRDIAPATTRIYFELTGSTGTPGTDFTWSGVGQDNPTGFYYVDLTGSSLSKAITITPVNNPAIQADRVITAKIVAYNDARATTLSPKYKQGSATQGTVTIQDSSTSVSLAVLKTQINQDGSTNDVVSVTRSSASASALTVYLKLTGTAQPVYDYYTPNLTQVSSSSPTYYSFTIPAGQTSANLQLTGVQNGQVEADTTLNFQLLSATDAAAESPKPTLTYRPNTSAATVVLHSTTQTFSTANAFYYIDFEPEHGGMKDATSQYYVAPIANPVYYTLYPEGDYEIGANPNTYHNMFYSMYDHTKTTSSGHMMIINGAPDPGTVVLQFSVSGLSAYQPLYFSYYGTSVNPGSPALMQMLVNGTDVGQAHFQAAGGWTQYTYVSQADANGKAVIQFINLNTDRSGNDFALDDISVGTQTRQLSSVHLSNATTPSTVKETDGTTAIFTVTRDADVNSGSTQRIYFYPTASGATYGTDYTSTRLQYDSVNNVYYIDMQANELQTTVSITPVADWKPEGDETLGFRLLNFNDAAYAIVKANYYPADTNVAQFTFQDVNTYASVSAINPNLFKNQGTAVPEFKFDRTITTPATRVYFTLDPATNAVYGTNFTWTGATKDTATGLWYVDFAAGDGSKYVVVQPINTTAIAGDMNITVDVVDQTTSSTYATVDFRYLKGSPATATSLIHDGSATVNLGMLASSVREDAGTTNVMKFTGTAIKGTSRIYFVLDTATTANYPGDFTGLNYDAASGFYYVDIDWTQGQTVNVPITPVDDWVAEPNETIAFRMVTTQEASAKGITLSYKLGSTTSGSLTLVDYTPTVAMTLTKGTWNETDSAGEVFHFQRTVRTGKPTRVYFKQDGGTGSPGLDYNLSGATYDSASGFWYVDFGTTDTDESVTLTPVLDLVMEGGETSIFRLATPAEISSAYGVSQAYNLGSAGPYTVKVNDSPYDLTVGQLATSVNEDDPSTSVVRFTRSNNSTLYSWAPMRVYFTVGGSATVGSDPNAAGVDYTLDGATWDSAVNMWYVSLPAYTSSVDVKVKPVDDWVLEPNETIAVKLAGASDIANVRAMEPAVGAGNGLPIFSSSNNSYNVTLVDRTPTVNMTMTSAGAAGVAESQGSTQVATLTRDRSTKAQTVYVQASGTATLGSDPSAAGVDYTLNGITPTSAGVFPVYFAAGQTTATVSITPVDDFVPEADEAAQWTVLASPGPPDYQVGSAKQIAFVIKDSTPTVTITSLLSLIREDAGVTNAFQVTRSRPGVPPGAPPLTLPLPLSGKAPSGTDYVVTGASSGGILNVQFGANDLTQTITLVPIQDTVAGEGNETVFAQLSTPSGTGTYRVGNPSVASLSIQDTTPTVTITALPSNGVISEDAGTVSAFKVSRTASLNTTLPQQTVSLNLSTVVGDTGFTFALNPSASGSQIKLNFAANQTDAIVTLTPTVDSVVEKDETVTVSVASVTVDTPYAVGPPSSASVTLRDATPVVSVAAKIASLKEDGSPNTTAFTVSRTVSTTTQTITLQAPGLGKYYTIDSAANPNVTSAGSTIQVTLKQGGSNLDVSLSPIDWSTTSDQLITWTVLASQATPGYVMGSASASFTFQADLPVVSMSSAPVPATGEGMAPSSFSIQVTTTGGRSFTNYSSNPVQIPVTLYMDQSSTGETVQRAIAQFDSSAAVFPAQNASGYVTVAAGDFTTAKGVLAATKSVTINPRQDLIYEGTQFLHLTLGNSAANPPYTLAVNTAKMEFDDDEKQPGKPTLAAVIVSGASSDPWSIVDTTQTSGVILQGGLVALGSAVPTVKNAAPPLTLRKDSDLLVGNKLPPLVPTVLDTRIEEIESSSR